VDTGRDRPGKSGANQKDGTALRDEYATLGLDLALADNTVEAGIHAVYRRLVSGRLKVFRSLVNFRSEIALYRRDEKGKVVKERDHLMDAARYLMMSGMARASTEPQETAWDDEAARALWDDGVLGGDVIDTTDAPETETEEPRDKPVPLDRLLQFAEPTATSPTCWTRASFPSSATTWWRTGSATTSPAPSGKPRSRPRSRSPRRKRPEPSPTRGKTPPTSSTRC
jgi:hypothetical protein